MMPPRKRNIVLMDIDHTVRAAWRRDHMIGGPWDDYHLDAAHDEPIEDMLHLNHTLYKGGYRIFGLTAIPEKWRGLTQKWLTKHEFWMHEMLMRSDDAFHQAPELKLNLIRARFPDPEAEIAMVLEDREDVARAIREVYNITVLVVQGRRP